MGEKRVISQYHELVYKGPLNIKDFYVEIDKWLKKNGFEKEIKEQIFRKTKSGREVRYNLDLWKQLETNVIETLSVKFQFSNVKDIIITKNKKKIHTQHVNLLMDMNAFVEAWKVHGWENKPGLTFIRGIIDRFVKKNIYEKYDGQIGSDAKTFYSYIQTHLKKQGK